MRPLQNEKEIAILLMRLAIYFCVLMGCVFLMWHFAEAFNEATFEEYGIVENLQFALLCVSSFSFLVQSVFKTPYRGLSLILGLLCLTAACRELDTWFDALWFLGWKFALIFPVFALVYISHHLNDFRKSVINFCSSSAFFMMYGIAIIILVIAQCVGHRSFFMDALGPTVDPRLIRRLFEESLEFIGYAFLLLASVEYYIALVRKAIKPSTKKIK